MYKVPINVLKDCKDIMQNTVFILQQLDNTPVSKALIKLLIKDAKKQVKLLKDNYYV